MSQTIIPRPAYIKQLQTWRGTGLIKIIMGPRRCGKSFLLHLFREALRAEGVGDDRLLTYDLNRFDHLRFHDPLVLHEDIFRRRAKSGQTFVFIDEIQACRDFEKLLSSLEHEEGLDIYVTGSNACMLSGELMTYLTGRYISIEMLPLSFAEFREAVREDGLSAAEDFNRYLRVGSCPAVVPFRHDPCAVDGYYELLIDSMIYKDVGQRLRMKDPTLLKRLIGVLASGIGSAVSARCISNALTSVEGRREVSDVTVGRYLEALTQCCMFVQGRRFDVRGNAALSGREKYYLSDPGMRDRISATAERDPEHLLENAVFLELKRRHAQVWAGRIDETEIDFVCRDGDGSTYFQVAATVLEADALERELRPFGRLRDRHPCVLLTLDRFGVDRNVNGVRILNVVDWLLDSQSPS